MSSPQRLHTLHATGSQRCRRHIVLTSILLNAVSVAGTKGSKRHCPRLNVCTHLLPLAPREADDTVYSPLGTLLLVLSSPQLLLNAVSVASTRGSRRHCSRLNVCTHSMPLTPGSRRHSVLTSTSPAANSRCLLALSDSSR